eukprot:TRINITY_DN14005_c0_g1_i1.p1 TRINITY_DN14005_c0_g1~~TRINITY_DN14005_c0_g1_i1.p1  ORF type:complete len:545 (+),score=134.96 TRINITY_DN14005_c0_g1_i1:59-1693(+)
MALRRAAVLAIAAALCHDALATSASDKDLKRARTKKPADIYKGAGQAALSQTLNRHLKNAEVSTKDCKDWTPEELQDFMAMVSDHRHPELQKIYSATSDRRSMKFETTDEHRATWQKLNTIVGNHPHLHEPVQEAHCREAVMWWTHHLADEKKQHLRATKNVTVPLLPENEVKPCGTGDHPEESHVCLFVNEKNSCDWCHSTQAAHDQGVPNTAPPDALKKFTGPDDGNPKGWDRLRRCDQDQMPRCQLCEGVGGRAWSDKNSDIDLTPCEVVAEAKDVNMSTVAPPLYSKQFTVRRKDGKQGGYSDTLIGWKTDPFCLSFFPQNDSIKPLCYRSEDSTVKYYDIEREASRIEYTIHNEGPFSLLPNTSAIILQKDDRMWIQNHLWAVDQCVCADPSGNHCSNPPCHTYIHRYDTFKTAQYLGREKINVEWIQDHGTGKFGKPMELDHFILWSHHVWTDPVSRRLVRAWKPFNGLQVYDPEAWTDSIEDPDTVFQAPPPKCKKGGAKIRIHCDDDGHYHPGKSEGMELLEEMMAKYSSLAEIVV